MTSNHETIVTFSVPLIVVVTEHETLKYYCTEAFNTSLVIACEVETFFCELHMARRDSRH